MAETFDKDLMKEAIELTRQHPLKPDWCICATGPEERNEIFKDDNQCTCGVRKHHYRCDRCGCIT